MKNKQWDLCIIGAGPAGMEAALSAASCGLEVALLDEHETAGGHIYKGLQSRFADQHMDAEAKQRGLDSLARLAAGGVHHFSGHTVWFASGQKLIASHAGHSQTFRTRTLIVANGAMERPVPFPGWTLPGVMSAGGADLLWRSAGLSPQGPVVISGNGPLMLLVAARLAAEGVHTAALIDTGEIVTRLGAVPLLPAAVLDMAYTCKGLRMAMDIIKSRMPVIRASSFSATGNGRLEHVHVHTAKGKRTIPASTLLVHEGFIPRTHISRLLRCAHTWNRAQRYWHPYCDKTGASKSHENVFFTGDGCFVHGADAAHAKGRLTGLAAAYRLGALGADELQERSRKTDAVLTRLLVARAYVNAFFKPAPGIYAMPDETLVCRCEMITAKDIRDAVREGCTDINDVKTRSRAGMGQCQGRMCAMAVAEVMAAELRRSPNSVGMSSVRPPLRPIPMQELCEFED
ncbi:NAD(P)/FAD-dependent oxidoreductase [Desulfovibrio sp. OttesenSCG-928-G15]|nr:NAD(P)/FAD-dependent oxidoreductase [Desulfovibrio sp. OttesenSCG-928-G15]